MTSAIDKIMGDQDIDHIADAEMINEMIVSDNWI